MKQYMMGLLLLLLTGCQQAIDHMMRDVEEKRAENHKNAYQKNSLSLSRGRADGKAIFAQHCASCHNMLKDATGPGLQGVLRRWSDVNNLRAFVRDSRKVIESGDKYAVSLYEKWNKTEMPAFPNLTDPEIDAVLQNENGCSMPYRERP